MALSENKKDLLTGLGSIPALSLGADAIRNATGVDAEVFQTLTEVTGMVDGALEYVNEASSGLLEGTGLVAGQILSPVIAATLTNEILKKSDWMNEHQKIRWAINAAVAIGAYSTAATTAPLIMTAGLAYALGKPGWKFAKGLVNRAAGTAWGLTGGAIKGAVKSGLNGLKGKQWEGTGMGRINPNIN